MNTKIYGLALGALVGGMLASCTNELNDPTFGPIDGSVKLVHAPDVYAWSGDQVLGNTFNGTRFNLGTRGTTTEYDYNFPDEINQLSNMSVPSDAIVLEDNWDWYNKYENYSGNIFIPADESRSFQVPLHFTGDIYVAGTYSPETLGNNDGNTIYVLPNGELNVKGVSTNGNTIYNAGKLNLLNGFDGSKIQNIYTNNSVIVGSTTSWGKTLPDNVNIYSKGGYVEFNCSDDYQSEWYYSQTLINGTIICDNIVQSNGKIKFQSSGTRDICHLISTDLVEITDGNNTFGEITAPNLKFDGAKIKLHPQGLVDITNTIDITNSGCAIIPASNSVGLVKCQTLNVKETGDQPSSIFPEGIYFNVSEDNITYQPDNNNGLTYIKERINTTMRVNPACGDDVETETPETPVEPEDNCDKCGHPSHGDTCDECGENEGCNKKEGPEVGPGQTTPDDDVEPTHDNEVEVNLSINDSHPAYDNSDLWTKLSIHVRKGTDVEVIIPLPTRYVVDSDDFAIVQNHSNGAYTGDTISHDQMLDIQKTEHSMLYTIKTDNPNKSWTVSLTIKFEGASAEYPNGCIRITTDGIDQEGLIDYLMDKNGDGINFEVWLYFQTGTIDKGTLKYYLDQSTIKFLDKEPDYFINAFKENDNVFGNNFDYKRSDIDDFKDCNVSIHENDRDKYNNHYVGSHLNDSDKNWIYVKKGVNADDAHSASGNN